MAKQPRLSATRGNRLRAVELPKIRLPWAGPKVDPEQAADLARADQVTNRKFSQHIQATNPPFYRSIRVRLTAWYALVLIVIFIALGLVLREFLIRSIEQNTDSRLVDVAGELAPQIRQREWVLGQQAGEDTSNTTESVSDLEWNLGDGPVALSGVWVGVFNPDGELIPDLKGLVETLPEEIVTELKANGALGPKEQRFLYIDVEGSKNRVFSSVLVRKDTGEVIGWIVVGEPLASRERLEKQINSVLQISGVTAVILATIGGWLIAGRALAPVQRITRTADQIANSDGVVSLSRRLEVPPTADELSRLSLTFNSMLDRIETVFTAQRRFVGDASHELRTPLTSIRGNVEVMLRQYKSGRPPAPEDAVEALGDVHRESERMARLIEDLLALARTDADGLGSLLKAEPLSLDVLAREAFSTANALVKGQNLVLDTRDSVMLPCDGDRLVQVMLILMDNALRHTPAGGTVTLRVSRDWDSEEGQACARIDVQDTGSGIPAAAMPHLFERFWRLEGSRNRTSGGTGLGLSIALAIVRGHGGWVDVESAPGEGSTFTVWIPIPENNATETV